MSPIRVALLILLISLPLAAEPAEGGGLNLRSALEEAAGRSLELRAGEALLNEMQIAVDYAAQWRNPELDVEGGVRSAASGGPLEPGGRAGSYRITVAQPFRWPGAADALQGMAAARRSIAALQQEEARLLLRQRVAGLFYAIAASDRLIDRANDRLRRLELIEIYLRSRPFLSPAQQAERNLVRDRLRILGREHADLRVQQAALWTRLNIYLQREQRPALEADWLPQAAAPQAGECQRLRSTALERNSQIQIQGATLAAAEAELRRERIARYPEAAVTATLSEDGSPLGERYLGFGLRLQLPLFDRNQRGVAMAEARLQAEQIRLQQRRTEIDQLLSESCERTTAAAENLNRFPPSLLQRVDANLRGADQAFRTGRLALLTFLELDSASFQTAHEVYQAQANFALQWMGLYSLAGEFSLPAAP
ncbi:MAG: TolC family protein [Leptospirales bacterium]|nr:TolC family protein [Leptospirales bacterium]